MTNSIRTISNRDSLLEANAEVITAIQKRLQGKRFKASVNDVSKLGYLNALSTAIKNQADILRDCELEEIKVDIQKLKGGR